MFTDLAEDRAARALTVLARAAHTQPGALSLLCGAFAADIEHLAIPAISVAVETNSKLGELLSEALGEQQVSVGTLEKIASTAPYPSLALAKPAAVVLKRLADHSADDSERAWRLGGLSNRLGDLGRREEALAAAEQAVDIYSQLAEARPDEFLPDLAASLNNQSNRLAGLGRREEALAAIEQAVDIYSRLAQARPDEFLPDLARSLNNQSNHLAAWAAGGGPRRGRAGRRHLQSARPGPSRRVPPRPRRVAEQPVQSPGRPGRREEALAAIEQAVTTAGSSPRPVPTRSSPTWPGR